MQIINGNTERQENSFETQLVGFIIELFMLSA